MFFSRPRYIDGHAMIFHSVLTHTHHPTPYIIYNPLLLSSFLAVRDTAIPIIAPMPPSAFLYHSTHGVILKLSNALLNTFANHFPPFFSESSLRDSEKFIAIPHPALPLMIHAHSHKSLRLSTLILCFVFFFSCKDLYDFSS